MPCEGWLKFFWLDLTQMNKNQPANTKCTPKKERKKGRRNTLTEEETVTDCWRRYVAMLVSEVRPLLLPNCRHRSKTPLSSTTVCSLGCCRLTSLSEVGCNGHSWHWQNRTTVPVDKIHAHKRFKRMLWLTSLSEVGCNRHSRHWQKRTTIPVDKIQAHKRFKQMLWLTSLSEVGCSGHCTTTSGQDASTWKVQKNAIYQDKMPHMNFGGNPLHQATKESESESKWHLNKS